MYLTVIECVCDVGNVFMLGENVYKGEKGVKECEKVIYIILFLVCSLSFSPFRVLCFCSCIVFFIFFIDPVFLSVTAHYYQIFPEIKRKEGIQGAAKF